MGRRGISRPVAGLLPATLLLAVPVLLQAQVDDALVDEAVYTAPRPLCPCVGPVRGSIVIAGGGALPADIYRTFVRLARDRRSHTSS